MDIRRICLGTFQVFVVTLVFPHLISAGEFIVAIARLLLPYAEVFYGKM